MMTPNKMTLGVIMIGIATLAACQWFEGSKNHHDHSSVVVINVLDKEYYDRCRITGSINVPLDQLEEYAKKNLSKDTHIVIYCGNYKCLASSEGAKMLTQLGFEHVWAYEGGSAEWKKMGYPMEGECKDPYLEDLEKPEEMAHEGVNMITAEELKKKLDQVGKQCC